jgi:hypothetical protein
MSSTFCRSTYTSILEDGAPLFLVCQANEKLARLNEKDHSERHGSLIAKKRKELKKKIRMDPVEKKRRTQDETSLEMLGRDAGLVRSTLVCFSCAPTTKTCYLLLGLERQGDHWCDFGGSVEEGESGCEAAAREFGEESLCVVQFERVARVGIADEGSSATRYIRELTALLASGSYFLRMDIKKEGENDVLKEVPWQPEAVDRFTSMSSRMGSPWEGHPGFPGSGVVKEQWCEKSQVAWWSFDRLRQVLRNDGSYKGQRFRRRFLPTLAMLLDHLETANH